MASRTEFQPEANDIHAMQHSAAGHDRRTIVSMAVIASAVGTLLHEGVGHGVIAWLRNAVPTELTTNHLSTMRPDHWVEAGGTLVNLAAGGLSLALSRRRRVPPNTRYFFWLLGAFNLLAGAGYFIYSGIGGFGDWAAIIAGLPHQLALRVCMSTFGIALYFGVVTLLAGTVVPFVHASASYGRVGRLPYLAAGIFECVAGLLDPLGWRLLLISTAAASFGGSSGLLWANWMIPTVDQRERLSVGASRAWWAAAALIGGAYIGIVGPGIRFRPH